MEEYIKDFIENPKTVLEKRDVIEKYKQVYNQFKDFPGQTKDFTIAWMSGHLATLEDLNIISKEKSGMLFKAVLDYTEIRRVE